MDSEGESEGSLRGGSKHPKYPFLNAPLNDSVRNNQNDAGIGVLQ